jgi:predicted amidophosphoribosyltransferase
MSCATPLARLCAGCNADLPEGARFCPQCAHPVEAPTSGPSTPPDRDRELREAHRLYTEMGATGHAERLAKELAPS